jgi:hypothetical protein
MTTDMERELRELFREKADDAPIATFNAPTAAPQEVLRRGRRHQVGTVLGSAAIVLVLIVGSVAGLNAVLRGEDDPFKTGDYHVFERTATIEAFTVTSPSDWYLVNEWPLSMQTAVTGSGSASGECTAAAPGAGQPSPVCTDTTQSVQVEPLPHGLPMFQLSNADMGLNTVSCGQDLPANAAVLYVGLDYQRAIFGAKDLSIEPWPAGLRDPEAAGGPCGAGRYATFSVNGEPFFAWVGFGADVTDADRSTVLAAYASMTVDDGWAPVPPEELTPAYVIAGGVNQAGDDWRLEVRPSQENVRLSLVGASLVAASSDFVVPRSVIEWAATDPIFGAITKQAAAVEFRSKDDSSVAIAGTIVPLPPSMAFDFDLFFIEGTAGIDGEAVALGPDGDVIEGDSSVGRLRQAVVELSGSELRHDWSARFSGAFADRSACIRVTVAETNEPLCIKQLETSLAGSQPSMHLWATTQLAVFAGSVPPEVVGLRFTSDDGTDPPQQFRCQMGPAGWTDPDKDVCAIALPPEGSGTLQYLDTNGAVLFEEGNGWGSAEATSNEYPWANEGGTLTARGSFQGADWNLEVLYYRDGYRLSVDGRRVFEGTLRGGEPVAFPLFEGDRGRFDALVLLVDGGSFADRVSISSEGTWDGRWLPGSDANGGEARLWVFEIPGAGTGRLLVDGIDRGEVSWP